MKPPECGKVLVLDDGEDKDRELGPCTRTGPHIVHECPTASWYWIGAGHYHVRYDRPQRNVSGHEAGTGT